jgi:hypothetical protein
MVSYPVTWICFCVKFYIIQSCRITKFAINSLYMKGYTECRLLRPHQIDNGFYLHKLNDCDDDRPIISYDHNFHTWIIFISYFWLNYVCCITLHFIIILNTFYMFVFYCQHSKIYKTLHIKLMIEQHNNTTKESSFLESV